MQVYVVMSNDYPDCVFESGVAAHDFVEQANKNDEIMAKQRSRARIYYKVHEFTVER